MKRWYSALCSLFLMVGLVQADQTAVEELKWQDLIPEGFTYQMLIEQLDLDQYDLASMADDDPDAQRLYNDMVQLFADAPVVDSLDGRNIRIPGFVVPLELDEDRVLSFLLVPYFGACIHTPPPPSNQIVYVEVEGDFKAPALDDPVYVTGLLNVEHQDSDLGAAGYTLRASKLESFL